MPAARTPFALLLVAAIAALPALARADQDCGPAPGSPLVRSEPQLWDVRTRLITFARPVAENLTPRIELDHAALFFPVATSTPFGRIDESSMLARLWVDSVEDPAFNGRASLESGGLPHDASVATMPLPTIRGAARVRAELSFRAMSWNARVADEAAMARITWPRAWPEEIRPALAPDRLSPSDDALFARAVQDAVGGRLRLMPPWHAAKHLVRHVIRNVRVSRSDYDTFEREPDYLPGSRDLPGCFEGLSLAGALVAGRSGEASPSDLSATCVAVLRAAGLPARMVVGLERERADRDVWLPTTWLELWLPRVGWIPIDPIDVRDGGHLRLDPSESWLGFGNLEDLHDRVRLGSHLHPPTRVPSRPPGAGRGAPALWTWNPGPQPIRTQESCISFQVGHAGDGRDDLWCRPPPPAQPAKPRR